MLLEAAYSDGSGYAQIVVGHYEADKLVIDTQRWFQVPSELPAMQAFVAKHPKSDVYFTPSTFLKKERHVDETKTACLIWADADACPPDAFRVTPSFTVETSPDRFQCYWLLDQPVETLKASELAHRISFAHKDEGCDVSSWPANKLMRVPGTTHGKTKNKHTVTLASSTGEMYSFEELSDAYADVVVPDVVRVMDVERGVLPAKSEVVSRMPAHLMGTFIGGNFIEDKRSEARWLFETQLFQEGFEREYVFEAVKLAAGGRLEKFTEQGREEQLWREVCKAYITVNGEEGQLAEGLLVLPALTSVSFLSDEEREYVDSTSTFIDDYCAWALSKSPQSAPTYHRSLALFVLSSVYGNWGYITPRFGHLGLNLWFVIVGPTTRTRKSTARRLALKLIHKWEDRSGKRLDIGSDATGEALIKTLSERDGLVSVFHRDEFQGWLKELYTKNYMSGMLETLTDLYDGDVKQVLRNSKDAGNNKRAKTIFNMLMMGIEEEIAALLTTKNFASGFLPRMLWSVADAPPWTEEDEYMEQVTEEEEDARTGLDPVASGFVQQFELARRKWNSTTPKRMVFEDDAWARWNQWKVESKKFIQGLPNEDIMDPGRDRMSYSILKAAALLSIHERSPTVKLEHLLCVLHESESWFKDMIRMANAIASSDFEAKCETVLRLVAEAGGTLPRKKVYSAAAFKGTRVGEVDEYIRSLQAQGKIRPGTIKAEAVLQLLEA